MEAAHKNREYRVSIVAYHGDKSATVKCDTVKGAILAVLSEVNDEWLSRCLQASGPAFELTLVVRRDP